MYIDFNLHLQGENCDTEENWYTGTVASYTSFTCCCLYFSEGGFPSYNDFGYR
jgi:hypothetical protein